MEVLHPRCAGLDVHKDSAVACIRIQQGPQAIHEVATFGTTTEALLKLSDWLGARQVTHEAMEATGVYWKPVWHVLDGTFELVLANAMHIKNVPGRKTDVNDATWIADLLAHGLIRASFVPPTAIQDMRTLMRTRKQLVRERAQHVQRIQKTLEDANLKIASAVSDVMGTSGRAILQRSLMARQTPKSFWPQPLVGFASPPRRCLKRCEAVSARHIASCASCTLGRSTRSNNRLPTSTRRWGHCSIPFAPRNSG